MRVINAISILTAVLLLAGCATGLTNPNMMSAPDIAGIVRTANQGEIDQGNAAAPKATNAEVKAFAQMMVTDHSAALNAANDLFTKHAIVPADNDTTRSLQSGSQQTINALGTYSGVAFDRAYMQAMIDAHQWLLNTMDSTLIPASRGELKDLLTSQRAAVSTHLDRARQILSGLR